MALMNSAPDEDADYDAAVASGDIRNVLAVLERENKLPPGYLSKTAGIESNFNPNAKAKGSSATGLFQQTNGNAKQYGIFDRTDPVQSALGAAAFAGDNAAVLAPILGRDPTAPELYAGHQQGPKGAAAILSNPSAPMTDLVGYKAAANNRAAGLTGGQFMDRFAAKFGSPSVYGTTSTAATPLSGSEGSDSMTGGGGSDRFQGGLASKPYVPAKDEFSLGDTISALGASMMSGTRQAPLGNFAKIMAAQDAEKARREDRRYGMWKDERNFGVGRQDAAQAQANADRSFGLQERGVNSSEANTKFSQDLQTKADARAEKKADTPDPIKGADGAILERQDDGTYVTKVPGARKPSDYEVNLAAGRAAGLTGSDLQNYALTGKVRGGTVDAGDKKAILAADDQVSTNQNVIENLTKAKDVSKKAFQGFGASTRGTVAGAFGNEGGLATTELDNLVTGTALSQLKSIFGGNPTEGERAILLQIQGSSSLPDSERQKIYDRGIEMAQRRLDMNKQRADGLRSGTYYQPKPQQAQPSTGGFDITTIPEDARRAEARRRGLIQ